MNAPPERQPVLNRTVDQYLPVRTFHRGRHIHPMPPALKPLDFRYRCEGGEFGIDEFIARNRISGIAGCDNHRMRRLSSRRSGRERAK